MKVNIDMSKLERRFRRDEEEAVRRAADVTEKRVKDNIISSGRVDTGRMHDTIHQERLGPKRIKIASEAPYTIYQEKGIGPVTPTKAKALRFKPKGSGTFVFAMRTKGFPGAHFFGKAFRAIRLQDFLT